MPKLQVIKLRRSTVSGIEPNTSSPTLSHRLGGVGDVYACMCHFLPFEESCSLTAIISRETIICEISKLYY